MFYTKQTCTFPYGPGAKSGNFSSITIADIKSDTTFTFINGFDFDCQGNDNGFSYLALNVNERGIAAKSLPAAAIAVLYGDTSYSCSVDIGAVGVTDGRGGAVETKYGLLTNVAPTYQFDSGGDYYNLVALQSFTIEYSGDPKWVHRLGLWLDVTPMDGNENPAPPKVRLGAELRDSGDGNAFDFNAGYAFLSISYNHFIAIPFTLSAQGGSGIGPGESIVSLDFQMPVIPESIVLLVSGFDFAYLDGNDDHKFGRLVCQNEILSKTSTSVKVRFTAGIRDYSGDWDDDFIAEQYVTMVAALATPSNARLPPLRVTNVRFADPTDKSSRIAMLAGVYSDPPNTPWQYTVEEVIGFIGRGQSFSVQTDDAKSN
jgi:hypothetical protein